MKAKKELTLEGIRGSYKKKNIIRAIVLMICVAILFVVFCLISDITTTLVLTGLFTSFFGIFWILDVVLARDNRKKLEAADFRILETRVFDKEAAPASSDYDSSSFIFWYEGETYNYKFTYSANNREYRKHQKGDSCFLILIYEPKLKYYECERVYWAEEVTLADELRSFIITDEEVARINRRKYYDEEDEFWKVKHPKMVKEIMEEEKQA